MGSHLQGHGLIMLMGKRWRGENHAGGGYCVELARRGYPVHLSTSVWRRTSRHASGWLIRRSDRQSYRSTGERALPAAGDG